MSDLGLLSLKLNQTSTHLKQVNSAIDLIRTNSVHDDEKIKNSSMKLLEVLQPIRKLLHGEISKSLTINEQNIVQILQQMHTKNWVDFKNQINTVTHKLEKYDLNLSNQEIDCLDDVADAIDTECAQLFRRINGRL